MYYKRRIVTAPFAGNKAKGYYYYRITDEDLYGTIVIENDGFNKSNYVGMRIDTTIYDTEKYGLQTILKKSKVELVKDKKESYYCLKDTYGWLHIQFLDTVKHIVSGTFEFDAVNENNNLDTVKIREGRFDSRFLY